MRRRSIQKVKFTQTQTYTRHIHTHTINVNKKKQRIPKGENASKGTTTPLESSTNRSDKVLNLKEIKTKQTLKTTTTATDRGCTTGKQTLQNVKLPPEMSFGDVRSTHVIQQIPF